LPGTQPEIPLKVLSFRASRREADAGFTLVELMVATMVMAIIATAILSVLYRSFKDTSIVTNRAQQQNDGRLALERMTKDIREAQSLNIQTPNEIQVTLVNGDTHDWSLVGTTIQYSLNGAAPQTVVTDIQNTAVGDDLFAYAMSNSSVTNTVTITIQIGTKPSSVIPLNTVVMMRNISS
jgi:prepilin-type N-terminal cleavage/methylation domain-containing protein